MHTNRKCSVIFPAIYYILQPHSLAFALLKRNSVCSVHIVKVIVVRCRGQWDCHQSAVATGIDFSFPLCMYSVSKLRNKTFVAFICSAEPAACMFRAFCFRPLSADVCLCDPSYICNRPLRPWMRGLLTNVFLHRADTNTTESQSIKDVYFDDNTVKARLSKPHTYNVENGRK